MTEKVSEVRVEISELAVSILGWEVQDFRARVTTKQHKPGGSCFHKLAVSGVFRFNENDWTDCFGHRDYPTSPVMLLRSPAISAWPSVTDLYVEKPKTPGRPVRVSENEFFVSSYDPIDHSDLRIEITGYDSVDTGSRISDIPLDVKAIPVDIEDDSTQASVRLAIDQMDAFTHRADGDDASRRHGTIQATGRVTFGTPEELLAVWVATWRGEIRKTPTVADKAPFSRYAPHLIFDVLDESGFLLEQLRGDISIDISVDVSGNTPGRVPRWLIDLSFDPSDYSAPPSRIIAHVEDQ